MTVSTPQPIRIVVVGAGYAGATLAVALDEKLGDRVRRANSSRNGSALLRFYNWLVSLFFGSVGSEVDTPHKYEVTVVSQLPFFHHNVASLRAMVDASMIPRMMIPLVRLFDNAIQATSNDAESSYQGKFIQGKIENFTEKSILVHPISSDSGSTMDGPDPITIAYDYLVISTGSSYPGCKSIKHTEKEFKDYFLSLHDKIKQAKSVVVVGGGPVGVELVGELSTTYPDHSITLIHPDQKLVPSGGYQKLQNSLESALRSRSNVKILFGTRLSSELLKEDSFAVFPSDKTVKTTDGKVIEADVVFKCFGMKPNSDFMRKYSNDSVLDQQGRIHVNEYLQVKGLSNVFAMGDVADVPEVKLAYHAGLQVPYVLDNIFALIDSTPNSKPSFKRYPPSTKKILSVPLGKDSGYTQITEGFVLGNFMTRIIKSKDLFSSKYWSLLRLSPPTNSQ
jgi:NADH dehydrogenase FAD-containing subunit